MWCVTNGSLKETLLSLNVDLFNDQLCLSLAAVTFLTHYMPQPISFQHANCLSVSHSQQESGNHEYREQERDAGGQTSCVSCKVRDWKCWSCTSNTSQDSRAEPFLSTQHLSSHLTVTSLWAAIYSAALKTCKQSGKITFINGTFWKSEAAL